MKKILIVDDEIEIIELIKDFLAYKGFDVDYAQDEKGTYEKIKTFNPDIILLDIRLPDADGIDMLKKIKEKHPEIDVIMITGVTEKDIALKALDLGAADYITKPIDLNYLETSIIAKLIYK
ncbi:MAG: response regulator [Candidatus Marinimicrobia bacterium]|mgnify:CR=1 FL=1|nr:response regulator [Candidatus Neomarinimicrobiota bacterium]